MAAPSLDELNAGFDAAYTKMVDWIMHSPELDKNIPFIGNIRNIMLDKVRSPEGRKRLLELVTDVIVADNRIQDQAAGR